MDRCVDVYRGVLSGFAGGASLGQLRYPLYSLHRWARASGAYAFVSVVLFGAFYYMMPHLTGKRWPWPRLISLHFWLTVTGFAIYFLALTVGGFFQGIELLDPDVAFSDITRHIVPYLEGRSLGGTMMTLGHIIFGMHFFALLLAKRSGSAGTV